MKTESSGIFYGLCNMTIHSAIIDLRYRIISPETSITHSEKFKVQKSPCEFFFADDKGRVPELPSFHKINSLYTEYINYLATSFDQIKAKFLEIKHRCLTEKQRQSNSELLICPNIIFPNNKNEKEIFAMPNNSESL